MAHMYTEPKARAGVHRLGRGQLARAGDRAGARRGADGRGGLAVDLLINVPIGLAVVVVCGRAVAASPARRVPFDLAGQLAAIALVGCGIGALVEGGTRGWSAPVTIALLVGTAVAAAALVGVERTVVHPMLPPSLLTRPGFLAGLTVGALFQFGAYGSQYAISAFLQKSWGLDALGAGLAFIPFATFWTFASFVLARAVTTPDRPPAAADRRGRDGGRRCARAAAGRDRPRLVGAAPRQLPARPRRRPDGAEPPTVVLRSLPVHQSGLASGALNALRQVGGAVGLALFGPLLDRSTGAGGLRVCLGLVALGFLVIVLVVRRTMPGRPGAQYDGAAPARRSP